MNRASFRTFVISALVGFVLGLWIIQVSHRNDIDDLAARIRRLEIQVFSVSRPAGEAR